MPRRPKKLVKRVGFQVSDELWNKFEIAIKGDFESASEAFRSLVLWFESPYMAQLFAKFIEDLIDGVKRKTHEEIIEEA